jgi:hypothetical protein
MNSDQYTTSYNCQYKYIYRLTLLASGKTLKFQLGLIRRALHILIHKFTDSILQL